MVGPTAQSPIGALRQPQAFLECVSIPVRDPRTGEGYWLGRQAVIARAREHQQYGSGAHWRLMVGLVIVRPPNEAVEKVLGNFALPVGAPQSPRALPQV